VSGGAPTGKWPSIPGHVDEAKVEPKREIKLLVRRPGLPEITLTIDKDEFVIGRSAGEVDLVLDDDLVSRRHASLTRDERGYFKLTDLGSKNGIRYAERTVRRLNLVDGDEFEIGKSGFTFKAEMPRFEKAPPSIDPKARPRQDSVFADVAIPRPQADGDFEKDVARGSGIPDPAEPT
jgi:pSer/pThr/pTyr-binding forkhead associated (FHA) protein